MNQGVVMEVAKTYVVVLTPDGQFRKVPRKAGNDRIGEEIQFAVRSAPRRIWLSSLAAVACAALFGLIWFAGFGGSQGSLVAAYVTLDINPSLEFGINEEEEVIEASGLNEDGRKLLEGLDFKGKLLEAVTESVMQRVEEEGIFHDDEGDVVITSTMVKDDPKLDETKLTDRINDQVSRIIRNASSAQAVKVKVTTLAAPQEVRQEAQIQGVSTGKMTVYLIARNEGRDVTIEEMKTTSIHQIAKSWGGLQQVIDNKKKPDKDSLKKMLEHEQKKEKKKKDKEKKEKEKEKKEQKHKNDGKQNGNKPDGRGPNGIDDVKPTNGDPAENHESGNEKGKNEDSKHKWRNDHQKRGNDFKWNDSTSYKKWQESRKKWQEERKKGLEELKRQAEKEKKRAEDKKAEAKKQAEEKKREEERKKEERKKEERQKEEQKKEQQKKEQKKEQDNKNRNEAMNNSHDDKGSPKDEDKHEDKNEDQHKDRNRGGERD